MSQRGERDSIQNLWTGQEAALAAPEQLLLCLSIISESVVWIIILINCKSSLWMQSDSGLGIGSCIISIAAEPTSDCSSALVSG
jgi:hypothetical protein